MSANREFRVEEFDVAYYDAILARGLSSGVGERDGQMCIEAAICTVLGLKHGDDPGCVAAAVRSFKITLNDGPGSSTAARAGGLHDLGLAQLGSLWVVDDGEFTRRLAKKTIRRLIPALFRELFPGNQECLAAAERCESEGTAKAAEAAWRAAAKAAEAEAAKAAKAAAAWRAAKAAGAVIGGGDKYLVMSATIALEVLTELGSPGVDLLKSKAEVKGD